MATPVSRLLFRLERFVIFGPSRSESILNLNFPNCPMRQVRVTCKPFAPLREKP